MVSKKELEELRANIEYIRDMIESIKPGPVHYGSTGAGTKVNVSAEDFTKHNKKAADMWLKVSRRKDKDLPEWMRSRMGQKIQGSRGIAGLFSQLKNYIDEEYQGASEEVNLRKSIYSKLKYIFELVDEKEPLPAADRAKCKKSARLGLPPNHGGNWDSIHVTDINCVRWKNPDGSPNENFLLESTCETGPGSKKMFRMWYKDWQQRHDDMHDVPKALRVDHDAIKKDAERTQKREAAQRKRKRDRLEKQLADVEAEEAKAKAKDAKIIEDIKKSKKEDKDV